MGEILYTAGEIARLAGVSQRTIRFYDAKGLLKPVSYSKAGYRYYNQESLMVLQRILMLKYLGFSLQKIEPMLHMQKAQDMEAQIAEQKELLLQKKEHLEQLIAAIEMLEDCQEENQLDYLIRLLNLLTDEEKIREQYKTSSNLEKRIRLHEYSTSPQGWMEWVYERLKLQEKESILELGCGTGLLWQTNIYKLPEGIHLTLTDRSEGMLEKAKSSLEPYADLFKEKGIRVTYQIADADDLHLDKAKYHCIIANHMLYHVKKREACLQEIAAALKPDGNFFCSTVVDTHMRELHEMVAAFDLRIEMPFANLTAGFRLENAQPQLQQFFTKVERMDQDNDLIVDDVEAIYNYVYSYPGNAKQILDQTGKAFYRQLQERMEQEGAIFIHKSTGMFCCQK